MFAAQSYHGLRTTLRPYHHDDCGIDALHDREIDLRQGRAVQSYLGHIGRNADDFNDGTFHIGSAEFDVLA